MNRYPNMINHKLRLQKYKIAILDLQKMIKGKVRLRIVGN